MKNTCFLLWSVAVFILCGVLLKNTFKFLWEFLYELLQFLYTSTAFISLMFIVLILSMVCCKFLEDENRKFERDKEDLDIILHGQKAEDIDNYKQNVKILPWIEASRIISSIYCFTFMIYGIFRIISSAFR